jgi:hypothetical protein
LFSCVYFLTAGSCSVCYTLGLGMIHLPQQL